MTEAGPSRTTPSIVVVGDVMADVLVTVAAPFAHASDTPSVIATAPGGSAANQAVWLSRAGATVSLVAAVGADPFGDTALRTLEAEGVDVRTVQRVEAATGVVVALVEPDGQRSMLTDRGANLELSSRALDAVAGSLEAGSHLHLSGYCLLEAASRPVGLRAIELARSAGTTFSVDACSAGPLRSVGGEQFLDWTDGARFFFANLDEGGVLTGLAEPTAIAERLTSRATEVVLTLGDRGMVVAERDGATTAAAAQAARASDTTGAGDALCGTYLAGRLAGQSITTALEAASQAAAAAVATTGARRWVGYSRV